MAYVAKELLTTRQRAKKEQKKENAANGKGSNSYELQNGSEAPRK